MRKDGVAKLQFFSALSALSAVQLYIKMSGEILVLDDKFICQFVKC